MKSAGRWFKRLLTGGSIDFLSPGGSKDEEDRLQDFRAEEEERMSMWRVMSVGYENAGQYVDVSEWVGLYRLGVFPWSWLTDISRSALYEVSVRALWPGIGYC